MTIAETTLIAIGGGEFAEADGLVDAFFELLKKEAASRLVVMTVATNKPKAAVAKYNSIFRSRGIRHVESVDVSDRDDAFAETAVKKIKACDALFFTGGDQLNVTSLLGGSPVHNAIMDKTKEGFIIAGTSAGAAMMSTWMIASGKSDQASMVGAVDIAPGMDLVDGMIIDTHFSQRGRHGRLLTAVAHYPQALGVGIDERTGIFIRGGEFKVVGEGSVTIVDASPMKHSNLPYRKKGETLGLVGITVHVLPEGYKFKLSSREPVTLSLKKLAGIR